MELPFQFCGALIAHSAPPSRQTQSPPFVSGRRRASAVPPVFPPEVALRARLREDAQSRLYRASGGPAFLPVGSGANSRIVGATAFTWLGLSGAPRYAVLLSA